MNSPIAPESTAAYDLPVPADTIIRLENVSVRYWAPEERVGTFKEYAIRRLQQQVRFSNFYALQEVSLEVQKGEIFGIIGRNGAGKSTLLKVVSRVLAPTTGRIRIWGHISPLLQLGAGFHPELTGRENVFLNGTLLGHASSDIRSHLEDVMEFAELGGFIEAPLRTYSSGMVARLGFAVATVWRPDILILDEVLSVGDEAFGRKCQARMEEFRSSGTTTLMVTHDMTTILDLCTRAAWIEHGKIAFMGPAEKAVEAYHAAQSAGTL